MVHVVTHSISGFTFLYDSAKACLHPSPNRIDFTPRLLQHGQNKKSLLSQQAKGGLGVFY